MTTKQKLLSFTIIKEAKYFLRQDCSSLLLRHSFSNNQRKGLERKTQQKKQKKNCSEIFATPDNYRTKQKNILTTQWMLKYVDPIAIGLKKLLNLK